MSKVGREEVRKGREEEKERKGQWNVVRWPLRPLYSPNDTHM